MAELNRFDVFQNPETLPSRYDAITGVTPSFSWAEAASSQLETSITDTIMGNFARYAFTQTARQLSRQHFPEDKMREMGLDPDLPGTMIENILTKAKTDKAIKNEYIQQSVDSTSARLLGGLAGNIVDMPIYMGAEALTLALGSRFAALPGVRNLALTGSAAKFFETGVGSVAKTVGVNAMAAAAFENPLLSMAKQLNGETLSQEEAYDNIMYSALFAGLIDGFGKAFQNPSRTKRFAADDLNAFENGKKPSSHLGRALDEERFGNTPRLEFEVKDAQKFEYSGKTYAAHRSSNRTFNNKTQSSFESNLGEGVIAVTNREFAVKEATSILEGEKGQILELDLTKTSLLEVDAKPSDILKESIVGKIKEIDDKLAKKVESLTKDATLRDIIEAVNETATKAEKPELAEAIQNVVKELGFDGYKFNIKDTEGSFRGTDSDFGVHVFDKDKFTMKGVDDQNLRDLSKEDLSKYEDLAKEEIEYLHSAESDVFYSPEVYKELDGMEVKYEVPAETTLLKQDIDLDIESLSQIDSIPESLNKINPELSREVVKATEFCQRL